MAAPDRILEAPLGRGVLRFGLPLALGMGLQTTFNLVDAYLISRLPAEVAEPSLGAIGICDQIAAVGSIVSYGIATATAALVAQHDGRGDRQSARLVAWQSMLMVLGWSLLFGLLGIGGSRFILSSLVGAKGHVAEFGARYLSIMLGGSFSIFFLLQCTAIQRAFGSSKTPVALLLLSNVTNLVLAVLLVYGPGRAPPVFSWGPPIARALGLPRMELEGAAWATILARSLTLVPLFVIVARRFQIFGRDARTRPDRKVIGSIWRIAWPSSTQLVLRIGAMLVTQTLVARAFTTANDQSATTALGIVFRLETMALFVGLGWGSAAQTFMGQNLGAGQRGRAVGSGWIAAAYNAAAMGLLFLAYRAFGGPIVRFFDDSPIVVAHALTYLVTLAPSYIALGVGIVLGNAMAGAGATRTTMRIDGFVIFAFQVPASVLAVTVGTSVHLWYVLAATNVLSAVLYILFYRRGTFLRSAVRPADLRPSASRAQ
jgi:putative MATE family efflux protein